MIVAFVFCMVVFIIVVGGLTWILVRSIVNPILELRNVFALVTQDDLTGAVPTHASSLDMKILFEAFVNLMVALRFGSESYIRGNTRRALSAFTEALDMYTLCGKGIVGSILVLSLHFLVWQ